MNKEEFQKKIKDLSVELNLKKKELVDEYINENALYKPWEAVYFKEGTVYSEGKAINGQRAASFLISERHALPNGEITYMVIPSDKPDIRIFAREGDIRGSN